MSQTTLEQYQKENPDFKLSTIPAIKEKQLQIIAEQETPEQHEEQIKKFIAGALKLQTEITWETKLVEYIERYYPKYCGVRLTSDQINDQRMMWKDLHEREERNEEGYGKHIAVTEVTMNDVLKQKENYVCANCMGSFWVALEEHYDFYLMENIKNGDFIGTVKDGKEETYYREDIEEGHVCDCHVDCLGAPATNKITVDAEIKDELPEGLLGQKYLSEEIEKTFAFCRPIRVLSNGFGKDSMTELILNHANYDVIVFADTGSEQPETYGYIDYVKLKLPLVAKHKVRIIHSRYGAIEQYYVNRRKSPSHKMRDCTEKFKIEPIKQYLTKKYGINPMKFRGQELLNESGNPIRNPDYNSGVRGSKKTLYKHYFEMGICINYAEKHRIHQGNVWYIKNVFPLIEKKIKKSEEPRIIKACGWEEPVKSGCFFCFYANKAYWLKLRRVHPALYKRAVALYDNSTMRNDVAQFPSDADFEKYMKEFERTGDEDVKIGCECMAGNMASGQTRDREDELDTQTSWGF